MNDTALLLRDKNIRPSYARIRILDYLKQRKTHPPAEKIYADLIADMPTLSRTTVYNTLSLLADKGLLKPIIVENTDKRYDDDINDHGHFICRECGSIYDFGIDTDTLGSDELHGFTVDEKNVYFKGTCKKCLNNI
jgi:Fur family transcriptional regulator, peroxide stress response regulator